MVLLLLPLLPLLPLFFCSCWMLAAEDEWSGVAADELARRGVLTVLTVLTALLLLLLLLPLLPLLPPPAMLPPALPVALVFGFGK